MKSKNLLLNPFVRIAGWRAFAVGIAVVILTVTLGYLSHTIFIGNFQVKIVQNFSLGTAFAVQFASLAISVVLFYLAAAALSRNVRFADILGTVTLARWPFLLAAIPGFCFELPDTELLVQSAFDNTLRISDLAGLLVAGIITMAIAVFATILLYRAYKISSGLKGPKLNWSFAAVIVVSEIAAAFAAGFIM